MKLKEKYDLILGDFCINVLPKEGQSVFIKNISYHLKPDGLCMLKTIVRYDANRGDLAKSLQIYRTQKKHRPILETIMAPMFKYSYNFKKETVRLKDAPMLERFATDTLPKNAMVHPISSCKDFDEEKESSYPSVMRKYVLDKLPPERRTGFTFARLAHKTDSPDSAVAGLDILAQKVEAYGRSGREGMVHDYPDAADIIAERILRAQISTDALKKHIK